MKSYLKTAIVLSLFASIANSVPAAQSRAYYEREVSRVEQELVNREAERQKAIAIDPTFAKGFERKINEDREKLVSLKSALTNLEL